jgi:hypothetical protein
MGQCTEVALAAAFFARRSELMTLELNSWIRVSQGALEGVEGAVVREIENHRLLIALANSSAAGKPPILPGVYLLIQADCLEAIPRQPASRL